MCGTRTGPTSMDQPLGPGVVTLSRSETIQDCARLQAQLVSALSQYRVIEIDASAVAEADLTLVQTLISAHRTAAEKGGRLCVRGPLPENLASILERGGFLPRGLGAGIPSGGLWPLNDAGDRQPTQPERTAA
ncbi:STAS domain-containing protein [Zavarzinia sp. CC-PAN008]|uniref:STAS domain-containing protein n=1 Tax=Zavarzinia sp. CC-PAN008 TaxID=3243332 RepID=UPI003F744995